MLTLLLLIGAFILPSLSHTFIVRDALPTTPRPWTVLHRAPPDHQITLQFGLAPEKPGALEETLLDISDPRNASGRYGKWLEAGDVKELVRAKEESIEAVTSYLASHCSIIPTLSPASDSLTLTLPISIAETLLNTTYHVFKHAMDGDTLVRSLSWSLPEELSEHVDVVQPTNMFGRLQPHRSTLHGTFRPISLSSIPSTCNHTITPACLFSIYNVSSPSTTAHSTMGIAGYLGEWANLADAAQFYAGYLPSAAAANHSFSVELINNGTNPQDPSLAGGEANLDTQYAGAMSFPIPNTYYSTGGSPPYIPDMQTPTNTNEPYANFLGYLLGLRDTELPRTLTTSYGDDEQTVPPIYAARVCALFAQLGARGVSVVFSSGDGGVGDGTPPDDGPNECYTNDGRNASTFLPEFPASCPYVTSVGATYHESPERAVPFSGGGFSRYFARPAYQDTEVPAYLKTLAPGTYEGLYNPEGRGIPDVSAQGNNFTIVQGGQVGLVAGTSCSAPTFAGLVARLNDARIAANMPPLGFLNPWLYSLGKQGLNDITIGNNPGCSTNGFNASIGWDPLTGLGTPNFGKLLELAMTA